ncbi:glycosyltransferase family 2 protein [Frondihabitans cladoniiphilus]|uniref:Galactosyltransferase C-terminal domain-containing protein n=1 Tax=Frondihabitans cladoniiphilus TaxID=715785 RepID=A0ABP8W3B1_9MICO
MGSLTVSAAAMGSSAPPGASTAVVTLASDARLGHVRNQQRMLGLVAPEVLRVVVWLDVAAPPAVHEFGGALLVHVPPGAHGLRLAEGRNRGAAAALGAGAGILVFLDADCLPGAALVPLYERAARAHPEALLCGPVTYLPEGFALPAAVGPAAAGPATASAAAVGPGPHPAAAALAEATAPHPARPAPPEGSTVVAAASEYTLFWSLSFAVTAASWRTLGGFDTGYEGYGGEDTDFAFTARAAGAPLVWVGGADAYHQHHPTSSPPWQHLDDILRNGARFASRWETWPMEGWLRAFADAGAIEWHAGSWRRVSEAAPAPVPAPAPAPAPAPG